MQKTAYEVKECDWSSDVCSSDLTDQLFNLLVGRDIQKEYGQEPQVVLTMPLLEGTGGVDKMSKSFGNYVGIDEKPEDIYGKVMSVPDDLMLSYYLL